MGRSPIEKCLSFPCVWRFTLGSGIEDELLFVLERLIDVACGKRSARRSDMAGGIRCLSFDSDPAH